MRSIVPTTPTSCKSLRYGMHDFAGAVAVRLRSPNWFGLTTLLIYLFTVSGCGNSRTASNEAASFSTSEFNSVQALENVSEIRRDNVTDTLVVLRGENLSSAIESETEYQTLRSAGSYGEMALSFIARYSEEFRLAEPVTELSVTRVQSDNLGFHQARIGQQYLDLVVLDAEIVVHFDPDDRIYLVQGHYFPTPTGLSPIPGLPEDQVRRQLIEEIGENGTIEPGRLTICALDDGELRLAYEFEVRRSILDRNRILIDAASGARIRSIPIILNSG